MELRDRLKSLRAELDISPAKLSSDFGKSESTVRMWELGKSKPSSDDLIALAKYFNCSTDYLLGLSDIRRQDMPIDVVNIGISSHNIDFIQNTLAKWSAGKGYPYTDKRRPIDVLNEILECQTLMLSLLEVIKMATQIPSPVLPAVWGEGEPKELLEKAVKLAMENIKKQDQIKDAATDAAKLTIEQIISSITSERSAND